MDMCIYILLECNPDIPFFLCLINFFYIYLWRYNYTQWTYNNAQELLFLSNCTIKIIINDKNLFNNSYLLEVVVKKSKEKFILIYPLYIYRER